MYMLMFASFRWSEVVLGYKLRQNLIFEEC